MKEITVNSLERFVKIAAAVVGVFILYFVIFDDQEAREKRYIKATYDYEFHGVVVRKFIDKENRSTYTLVLNNGKKVGSDNELYDNTQVNDSVSKSKGVLEIQVFRKPDSTSEYVLLKEVYDDNVVRKRAQPKQSDSQ